MSQDLLSEFRVKDLRMILDRVQILLPALGGRHRAVVRVGSDLESRGKLRYIVIVAHPADHGRREPLIKRRRDRIQYDLRPAVFTLRRTLYPAPEHVHHELGSVAQSQNRDAHLEQFLRRSGGSFQVDTVRSSGQDDALRIHFPDLIQRGLVGTDLAIDLAFPHPPCDQLVVLTAEIDDDNFLLLNFIHKQSFRKPVCHEKV